MKNLENNDWAVTVSFETAVDTGWAFDFDYSDDEDICIYQRDGETFWEGDSLNSAVTGDDEQTRKDVLSWVEKKLDNGTFEWTTHY